LKYYVGCKGWKNPTWITEFYPVTLHSKDYLSYYSKVFDFAEVDLNRSTSPAYTNTTSRFPNKLLFKKWAESTPDNFRFAIKLPKQIIQDVMKIGDFLDELAPLEEKTLAVVIESLTILGNDGREWLDDILHTCTYHGYSVAFEFKHPSWFQDLTYNLLNRHKAAVVWSEFSSRYSYPVVTADFLYLRINGGNDGEKWIGKVKEKVSDSNTDQGRRITRNNHHQEEGGEKEPLDTAIIVVNTPSGANRILRLLDLPEKEYGHSRWIGKVIMHVDLNSFFPSCEELRDPTLRGKPHAVIMTDETKDKITRGAVASCSYEARKYGVRSATSLFSAKQLCPQLILNPVDKAYYQQVSQKVMRLLEEYADVLEQTSIDEAYLDCTKKLLAAEDNSGVSIEEYAAKIKDAIKQQCGLLSSIGVASTKSAAKIASDFKKPDGLTIIYADKLQMFLGNLDVDRIAGIGTKTQQALKEEMEIKTIGQLAKCDVQSLMDRFGKKNGLWMWQVANGRDNDIVSPREDNISISTEQTLDRSTNEKIKILQYLNTLVDEVYGRIKRHGYLFRTVGVKLVRSDFSIETREISFSNLRNDRESIASVLEELVDRFSFNDNNTNNGNNNKTKLAFRKVGIKISNLVRLEKKKNPSQQKTLLDYI
jgi:DNA polymerase IV (archaeal DinB-like DNA polymerase)